MFLWPPPFLTYILFDLHGLFPNYTQFLADLELSMHAQWCNFHMQMRLKSEEEEANMANFGHKFKYFEPPHRALLALKIQINMQINTSHLDVICAKRTKQNIK